MKITSYYPVIMTGDVKGTVDFYKRHLRFEALFASDWYVHLQSTLNEHVGLGVVEGNQLTFR